MAHSAAHKAANDERVEAIGVTIVAAAAATPVDVIVDVAPLPRIVKDICHMMAYFFISIVVVATF